MVSRNYRISLSYASGSTSSVNVTSPVLATSSRFQDLADQRTHGGPIFGWKKRLREGRAAITTFSASKIDHEIKRGTIADVYRHDSPHWFLACTIRGLCISSLPAYTAPGTNSVAQAEAMKRFLKEVRDQQRAMSGGVALGELRETLSMVLSPAKALRKGVGSYLDDLYKKKGKYKKKRDKLKVLSDSYLEFQFGAIPLINDVLDGTNALVRLARRDAIYVNIDKSFVHAFHAPATYQFPNIDQMRWTEHTRKHFEYTSRYKGLLKVPMSGKPQFAMEQFGVTIRDFVPTVWELIPFSFVADYFTNIGDVLEAFAINTANLMWVFNTNRATTICDTRVISVDPPPAHLGYSLHSRVFTPSSITYRYKTVSRAAVDPASLIPPFRLEIPGFKSAKWTNLGALAYSLKRVVPF